MGQLLEEALNAGALGFSTSRTAKHRAADGRPTPSRSATEPELAGIAYAMKRAGTGVIQVNSDFEAGEFQLLRAAAELAGRPLSLLLVQMEIAPDRWSETLASVDRACAEGLDFTAQVGSRPISILLGLQASRHPFLSHPVWHTLRPSITRRGSPGLLNDRNLRRRLIEDRPDDEHTRGMAEILERTFELGEPLDYEPEFANSIANRARAAGRDPFDLALELLLQKGGTTLLLHTFENYSAGDLRRRLPDAREPQHGLRDRRWRRPRRVYMRLQLTDQPAHAFGRVIGRAARGCRSNSWSTSRPWRRPAVTVSTTGE